MNTELPQGKVGVFFHTGESQLTNEEGIMELENHHFVTPSKITNLYKISN